MTYKKEFHNKKAMLKLEKSISKNKVKCKCGHTIVISSADRTICGVCGSWIYRTPEIEFRYKLMKKIKENR